MMLVAFWFAVANEVELCIPWLCLCFVCFFNACGVSYAFRLKDPHVHQAAMHEPRQPAVAPSFILCNEGQ